MTRCAVPPPTDLAAWAVLPEPEEVEECVAYLITAVEPALVSNPQRCAVLTALVSGRGYTRAELLLAMQQLPFANAYGQGFRLDVLDEIVNRSRAIRRIVADPADGRPRLFTERQMFDACAAFPEAFRPSDFGVCSFDADDRPLYVHAKRAGQVHAPQPRLPESAARRLDDDGPIDPRFAAMLQRLGIGTAGTGTAGTDATGEVAP